MEFTLATMWNITWKMISKIYLSHRGSWRNKFVENTLNAFKETERTLSKKLHGFECDFRQLDLTNETSWVIFHDNTMSRFNNKAQTIDPSKEITQYNRVDYIPSLEDFRSWLSTIETTIIINIEIKHGSALGVKYLIDNLTSLKKDNIEFIFSSFDSNVMDLLQSSNVNLGYLIDNDQDVDLLLKKQTTNTKTKFIAMSYEKREFISRLVNLKQHYGVYFSSYDEYVSKLNEIEDNNLFDYIFVET